MFKIAFWRFDHEGAVIKYDAWIPSLDDWIELIDGAPTTNKQYEAQTIQRVCGAAQTMCTGNNTQWDNVQECVADLSQRPYGTYSEAWGDNIVCRTIHIVLTQSRPEVSLPPFSNELPPRRGVEPRLTSSHSITVPTSDPPEAANVSMSPTQRTSLTTRACTAT